MGSSTSHHGSHPSPKQTLKRTISSIFICGSSSPTALVEMGDDSSESCHDPDNAAKLQRPRKEFVLPSGAEYGFVSPRSEIAASSESSVVLNESPSLEDGARTSASYSSYRTSMSYEGIPFSDPNSSNERVDTSLEDVNNEVIERVTQPNSQSSQEYVSHEREVIIANSSVPGPRSDTSEETLPSLIEFLETGREQARRYGVVQHDGLVGISSGNLSSANTEINTRELRQDGRRLFWDAFLRRSSRTHGDSRTFTFSPYDSGSRDRWLLDFGGDSLDSGARDDGRYLGNPAHNISRGRRHSRSEIWERIRGGLDGIDRQTNRCPSGLHSDGGACSCESILMAHDHRPHASISRIVMLAEALFEVLDEIHRQPMSLSLPMVSFPAPESVVNSLPVKIYPNKHSIDNDLEQCHICLAEYEEEDEIRVLPCQHEFHMSCVDKWLKETHRVCPLCRGDVCGVSSPEIHLA